MTTHQFNFPWFFDMSAAPRGEYVKSTVKGSKRPVEKETYQHVTIYLLGASGTVTTGKWLPTEERWEMFTKDVPPVAWMPLPTAPKVMG